MWRPVTGAYRSSRAEAAQPPWGTQPAVPTHSELQGQWQSQWEGVNSGARELEELTVGICSQLGKT